jgi:hypothetical protein
MKRLLLAGLALTVLGLTACARPAEVSPASHHGRYVGIGIYPTGDLWDRMVTAAPPPNADPEAARLSDDQQVIVVVDSDTGEIRQCGNFSGYCVGSNPWTKALVSQQQQPVALSAHAVDLPALKPAPEKTP